MSAKKTSEKSDKRPIFVKGKLKFEIDGSTLEFKDRNISLFGVMGLNWRPLIPARHFGKSVMVLIHIPTKDPVIFRTRARITREMTRYSSHMGLKFELGPAQTIKLRKTIEEHGFPPKDHVRKFPRIPAYEWLGDFPVRATVKLVTGKSLRQVFESVFDVSDLSPTGALIETENPSASALLPGQRISVALQPRGKFMVGVTLSAQICRIIDAVNPKNDNTLRQIGVSFTWNDKHSRSIFLHWLRDILTDLRHNRPLF